MNKLTRLTRRLKSRFYRWLDGDEFAQWASRDEVFIDQWNAAVERNDLSEMKRVHSLMVENYDAYWSKRK